MITNIFTTAEIVTLVALLGLAIAILYIYLLKGKIAKLETKISTTEDSDVMVYSDDSKIAINVVVEMINSSMKYARSTRNGITLGNKIDAVNNAVDLWDEYELDKVMSMLNVTDKELYRLENKYGHSDETLEEEDDNISSAGIDPTYEHRWSPVAA